LLLAVVADVEEDYDNMKQILDLVDINAIRQETVIIADLKLLNIIVWQSSHASTFHGPYCLWKRHTAENHCPERTFEQNKAFAQAFNDNGRLGNSIEGFL
jgi:hypothetical protein